MAGIYDEYDALMAQDKARRMARQQEVAEAEGAAALARNPFPKDVTRYEPSGIAGGGRQAVGTDLAESLREYDALVAKRRPDDVPKAENAKAAFGWNPDMYGNPNAPLTMRVDIPRSDNEMREETRRVMAEQNARAGMSFDESDADIAETERPRTGWEAAREVGMGMLAAPFTAGRKVLDAAAEEYVPQHQEKVKKVLDTAEHALNLPFDVTHAVTDLGKTGEGGARDFALDVLGDLGGIAMAHKATQGVKDLARGSSPGIVGGTPRDLYPRESAQARMEEGFRPFAEQGKLDGFEAARAQEYVNRLREQRIAEAAGSQRAKEGLTLEEPRGGPELPPEAAEQAALDVAARGVKRDPLSPEAIDDAVRPLEVKRLVEQERRASGGPELPPERPVEEPLPLGLSDAYETPATAGDRAAAAGVLLAELKQNRYEHTFTTDESAPSNARPYKLDVLARNPEWYSDLAARHPNLKRQRLERALELASEGKGDAESGGYAGIVDDLLQRKLSPSFEEAWEAYKRDTFAAQKPIEPTLPPKPKAEGPRLPGDPEPFTEAPDGTIRLNPEAAETAARARGGRSTIMDAAEAADWREGHPERGSFPLMDALTTKAADAIKSVFSSDKPAYESTLPPETQAKQAKMLAADSTRSAGDRWAEKVAPALDWLKEKGRVYGHLEDAAAYPGVGITTKDGAPLSLAWDLRYARKQQALTAPHEAGKAALRVQDVLKDRADLDLLKRVADARDALRMVKRDAELPVKQAAARSTIAALDATKKRRVDGLSTEEQARYDAAKKVLEEKPAVGYYASRTAAEIRAIAAEAEMHARDNPRVQEALRIAKAQFDRNRADLQSMGYEIPELENYIPRAVVHETPLTKGWFGGAARSFKAKRPDSAKRRGGSESPTDLDIGRLVYEQTRQIKQAKILHDFAAKLQASKNNLLPEVLRTGELPEGLTSADVVLWSFEQGAPEVAGMRLRKMLRGIEPLEVAEAGLKDALDSGDAAGAKQILHVFQNGRNRPYMLVKKPVADALTGMAVKTEPGGIAEAARRTIHDLFRKGTLVWSTGLGYLERNFFGDSANMINLVSESNPAAMAVDAGKAIRNVPRIAGRMARERLTGAEDPVLEQMRGDHTLQSGFIGSGAVDAGANYTPSQLRTPMQKIGAAINAPFEAVGGAAKALEAAPRASTVESLMRQGYNREGASIVGNTALVDYTLVDPTTSWARQTIAPFITYVAQTTHNVISAPVHSAKVAATKYLAPYLLFNLYNNMFASKEVREQEARLPESVRAKPHIATGRKDQHGREIVYDMTRLGFEVPLAYKPVLWGVSYLAAKGFQATDRPEAAQALERRGAALGRDAARQTVGLLGPIPDAAAALAFDYDLGNMRPLPKDEMLGSETLAKKNAARYGVPESVAGALGTAGSAAVQPFFGPYASARALLPGDSPNPIKDGDRARRFLGDPRQYVEPDVRGIELRSAELEDARRAMFDALDAGDLAEYSRLKRYLRTLGVDESTLKAWKTKHKKQEKSENASEAVRRRERFKRAR